MSGPSLDQRLDACWKWLPVFVHLAETENVAATARALHTTPPSVSKALKHVEEAMEHSLFDRVGGRLRLNSDGQALLAIAGPALRLVRREIALNTNREKHLAVGVTPLTEQMLMPGVEDLARRIPELRVTASLIEADEAHHLLEAETLDIIVGQSLPVGAPLECSLLARVNVAVYCGQDHPLAKNSKLTFDDLSQHRFAVGRRMPRFKQSWPTDKTRTIGLVADTRLLVLEAARRGGYLVIMDEQTPEQSAREGLVRLDINVGDPLEVVIAHRPLVLLGPTARDAIHTARRIVPALYR